MSLGYDNHHQISLILPFRQKGTSCSFDAVLQCPIRRRSWTPFGTGNVCIAGGETLPVIRICPRAKQSTHLWTKGYEQNNWDNSLFLGSRLSKWLAALSRGSTDNCVKLKPFVSSRERRTSWKMGSGSRFIWSNTLTSINTSGKKVNTFSQPPRTNHRDFAT